MPDLGTDCNNSAPDAQKSADIRKLPPMPGRKSAPQQATVAGTVLSYSVIVESLPVTDDIGRPIADVVFTAYIVEGNSSPRPVTFALNGGPGASSVYLNLGAIGPKRLQFGAQTDSPSAPTALVDNDGSWLSFSDLVFVDPVGTGHSRSLLSDEKRADEAFFRIKPDIAYLSALIYDWLSLHDRLASRKFIVGESYGGFRAPAIARHLQMTMGIAVSGIVMISPALNLKMLGDPMASPISWACTLPTMAASHFERQGIALSAEVMRPVEAYAQSQYVTDLMKGWDDPAALQRLAARVSKLTGIDRRAASRMGGRIDSREYLRALYRDEHRVGSWYDSNLTRPDPTPWSAEGPSSDPLLDGTYAPTTTAIVHFLNEVLGWRPPGRYKALNWDVNKRWETDWITRIESLSDLRSYLAVDANARVLIAHGYTDLSCPYFQSKLAIAQVPTLCAGGRISVKAYAGGHMFYSRPESLQRLVSDTRQLFDEK